MNGIFECITKDENDEDGRWRKTNAFCRIKGIDEIFVCLLNDVLGGLTCEAEIVNEITVEGLINDLRSFRSQSNPNRLKFPESATTQGKEH